MGTARKIGELICPACGGKVIQTESSLGARMSRWEKQCIQAKWFCAECSTEFHADLDERGLISKEVSYIQPYEYNVEMLGNTETIQK